MISDRESVPSGDEDVKPLELCRQDRKKLYGLLEADLPRRTKRIEYMLIGLLASSGVRLLGGVPIEQAPTALFRFLFG